MEKQKHSVRAILKPIYKTINYAMFLAALSACFFVANLVLISYFLASIANNSPLVLFGIEMGYYAILLIGFLSIIASILKMLAFKHSHLGAFVGYLKT